MSDNDWSSYDWNKRYPLDQIEFFEHTPIADWKDSQDWPRFDEAINRVTAVMEIVYEVGGRYRKLLGELRQCEAREYEAGCRLYRAENRLRTLEDQLTKAGITPSSVNAYEYHLSFPPEETEDSSNEKD